MWGWMCRRTRSWWRCCTSNRDVAEVHKIFNDEESVRRLIKPLAVRGGLWACYEAARPATVSTAG
jgi:hypothetical protein